MTDVENNALIRGEKALLADLMSRWPDVVWRLVSDEWPGGTEIQVHWSGEPPEDDVRGVAEKYEFPHFPGPADLNITRETPMGGAKFVTLYREK